MLNFLQRLQASGNLKGFFYSGQIILGTLFIVLLWFLRPKAPESNFRVRESDLRKPKPRQPNQPDPLSEARIQRHEPLRLEGIRIDGKPHEILGIPIQAAPSQIQQAYRDLMKRYHPDRVGRQGSREWQDAQKIAEAINRAKDAMMKEATKNQKQG